MKRIFNIIAASVIPFASLADDNPQIAGVEFSGTSGNYTLTINGSGFGSLPHSFPFAGDSAYLRIADAARLGYGEWGYSGDANRLTYNSWSDTKIVVSGLGGQPGDAIVLAAWNPSSGLGATRGGNVPGSQKDTPQITSVTFSGSGPNLQIIVHGSGFGTAPTTMPFTGDLNNFILGDFRTHCGGSSLFEAGSSRWGNGSPDSLTLNYQSWSDSEIVINGFGGSYGQGCDTLQNGDPVSIEIWNTSDTGQKGPQTAWGGFVTETADSVNLFTPCINGLQIDINGVAAPGASVTGIVWNWGDGQETTGFFPQSHIYSSQGEYVVEATAQYDDGSTASESQTVNVAPGILSGCYALTISAGQGGTVSYQASVGTGTVPGGESAALQLAYADDLSLAATPCYGNSFSEWSASSGITGLNGDEIAPYSVPIDIVNSGNSEISAVFSPSNIQPFLNWSGYVVGMPDADGAFQAGAVSDVKGIWVIPKVENFSPGDGVAIWVGIGGSPNNEALVQIGTALTYATGQYDAWYEVIEGNELVKLPVQFPFFPVNPGDTISAEVSFAANDQYLLKIENVSRGVSRTVLVQASLENRKTAEWIVEDPLYQVPPLADFGTIEFSDCSVTVDSQAGSINTVGATVYPIAMFTTTSIEKARPSAMSCDGSGFSVTWQHH